MVALAGQMSGLPGDRSLSLSDQFFFRGFEAPAGDGLFGARGDVEPGCDRGKFVARWNSSARVSIVNALKHLHQVHILFPYESENFRVARA